MMRYMKFMLNNKNILVILITENFFEFFINIEYYDKTIIKKSKSQNFTARKKEKGGKPI